MSIKAMPIKLMWRPAFRSDCDTVYFYTK